MKNKKIYITIIAVLLLIITALSVSTTYSKYKSSLTGHGLFEVANWSFLVNGQTSTITNIKLTNMYKNDSIKEGTIAPGASGFFDIIIDASGCEVGLDYKVEFINEDDVPLNLKFSYGENVGLNLCELQEVLKGRISANEQDKVRQYRIEWTWDYEISKSEAEERDYDITDTRDGMYLNRMSFDVVITGTQIEPQKA